MNTACPSAISPISFSHKYTRITDHVIDVTDCYYSIFAIENEVSGIYIVYLTIDMQSIIMTFQPMRKNHVQYI